MAPVLRPDDLATILDGMDQRLQRLENSHNIGLATSRGGTTHWQDASGNDQVVIGLESDNSYSVWVLSSVLKALGGLNTGQNSFHVFTGTTDPGGAAGEGDIWVKG